MRKLCLVFYNFLLLLLLPLVIVRLTVKNKGGLKKLSERFGFYNNIDTHGKVIWVHAVSVGETVAASAMIAKLQEDFSSYKIMLSVTTVSGRSRADSLFKEHSNVSVVYFPYDFSFVIKRLLTKFDFALFISMETEIWPNLYIHLSKYNVPILLANARLSAKSCRKYAKFHKFFKGIFAVVNCIAAQDKADARRFAFMGARNIKVLGSMKYDISLPSKSKCDLSSGSLVHFLGSKTFMAVSTHGNEEEIILEAFVKIKKSEPESRLILVPRHPGRAPEIVKVIDRSGFEYALYSNIGKEECMAEVLLVDLIGVLGDVFELFDVAYVGGSLVDRGGQNPIEPAFYSKPVLMGPSRYNFHKVALGMSKTGGLLLVNNADDIAREVVRLFGDFDLLESLGKSLLEHVRQQAGATGRHIALIKEVLCETV